MMCFKGLLSKGKNTLCTWIILKIFNNSNELAANESELTLAVKPEQALKTSWCAGR